jgi:acetolactate synthase-1/2/3 large subunit
LSSSAKVRSQVSSFARLQEMAEIADRLRKEPPRGGRDADAPTARDRMGLNRRDLLKLAGAATVAGSIPGAVAHAALRQPPAGVHGHMTGAAALVETLLQEGVECVYGIPGAQENELWDTFKTKHLDYLLVTHESSAAAMADGYARATGKTGCLCVVPGPGLTNTLTNLGEALLDSVPVVCIAGDVANGAHYRPFQVHCLDNAALLRPVTKQVFRVDRAEAIPHAVRLAFQCACAGEPGPVGVVIPYNLLLARAHFDSQPIAPLAMPCDDACCDRAVQLMSDRHLKVGIYAGLGCMNYSPSLVRLAELLQAPVATSICGKGAFPEDHPLSVGWGYGPQGTQTAEETFKHIDVVLAVGVKYSEVSTGFYSIPQSRHLIHVDINENNLGRIMRTDVCVHSDAGLFFDYCFARSDQLCRPANDRLVAHIARHKNAEARHNDHNHARCGVDPYLFLRTLRHCTCADALCFVDVTLSQYWASEVFTTCQPRTFFNPTDNQNMGWSIPAALGAQRVFPGRQTVTVTGDGCFLMSAMEISTAAREGLPVKFFILDDQAYHYMQELQRPAYGRTTATILARLNYSALAEGWGVTYQEITDAAGLEAGIRGALCHPGPVLVRVCTDYDRRPVRWINAARRRFLRELACDHQRLRFVARAGTRALNRHPEND